MKTIIWCVISMLMLGCNRHSINEYPGHIVKEKQMGFDNLMGSRYILIDAKTKKRISVEVDVAEGHFYDVGDTIK